MIFNMTGGGGGAKVKILSCASRAERPAEAGEGTIAVITDAPVSGYSFGIETPVSPGEGELWFYVGNFSPAAFPITKKDPVWVYPQSCRQFIGGQWVLKECSSFLDGGWVDWHFYLYSEAGPAVSFFVNNERYAQITYTDNGMSCRMSAPQDPPVYIQADTLIDFKRYRTMHLDYATSSSAYLGHRAEVVDETGRVLAFGNINRDGGLKFSLDIDLRNISCKGYLRLSKYVMRAYSSGNDQKTTTVKRWELLA